MTNILTHGLGQSAADWHDVRLLLKKEGIDTLCPNLFDIGNPFASPCQNTMASCEYRHSYDKNSSGRTDYESMYRAFAAFCDRQSGKLNLCGLSLGGILALNYAKENPAKVHSVILIGTPFKVPKVLFNIQSFIFHLMPPSAFKNTGCSKKDFISLTASMKHLDISGNAGAIQCQTLILCGRRDKFNLKSAALLHRHIQGSRLHIIQNASHEVNTDNPAALGRIICDFWKQKGDSHDKTDGK